MSEGDPFGFDDPETGIEMLSGLCAAAEQDLDNLVARVEAMDRDALDVAAVTAVQLLVKYATGRRPLGDPITDPKYRLAFVNDLGSR